MEDKRNDKVCLIVVNNISIIEFKNLIDNNI